MLSKSFYLMTVVAGMFLFATGVFAQEEFAPNQRPGHLEQSEKAKRAFVVQQFENVAVRLGETISQRYELDAEAVAKFKEAMSEKVAKEFNLKGEVRERFYPDSAMGKVLLINEVFSQPALLKELGSHLGESQVKDLVAFELARDTRDRKAGYRFMIASIDLALSLDAEQRAELEKRITESTVSRPGTRRTAVEVEENTEIHWWRPFSRDLLHQDEGQGTNHLVRDQLGTRRKLAVEDLLTPTQQKVWQLLIAQVSPRDLAAGRGEIDPNLARGIQARMEALIKDTKQAVDAGLIDADQAEERIEAMKARLQMTEERNIVENRATPQAIVEAKLAAHLGQLGPIEGIGGKRLQLVSKGVIEQTLEAQTEGGRGLSAAGETTSSRSGQRINPLADVSENELLQTTIAAVISEEALEKYKAGRTERAKYREQVIRELVISAIDSRVLLDDQQRNQFSESLKEFPVPPANRGAGNTLLLGFLERADQSSLTAWQKTELAKLKPRRRR